MSGGRIVTGEVEQRLRQAARSESAEAVLEAFDVARPG